MHILQRTLVGALRGATAMALIDGARTLAAGRLGRASIVRRDRLAARAALGAAVGALTGGRGIGRGLFGAAVLVAAAELGRSRFGYGPERRERRLARAIGFAAFGLLAGASLQRRFLSVADDAEPLPRPLPRPSRDRVDEESAHSFPASDPPSFTPGRL